MATQVDFYSDEGNELKWWDEAEDSEKTEQSNFWEPPKTVDLLHNVHINRTTHIKSPFYHRRYPYEFKTREYFKYKSETQDKPKDEAKKEETAPKSNKPTMKMELHPVKKKEGTYREKFKEKSLRQRIYDGEVFFYEDYLEYIIAKDYCRLFQRPFNVPRQDWGGQNFYYGQKVLDEKLEEEKVEIIRRESIKNMEKVNDDSKVGESETDALIKSTNYLDDFKRDELLKGEIPSLFETGGSVLKQKPRKDRWVSFHNLKNYGLMIDSVTKCPLLHVQLQTALQSGWNPTIKGTVLDKSDSQWPDETSDLYHVSPEQLLKVNQILSERKKPVEDPLPDITKLFKSKSYGINENCYTIGGGRYLI